MQHSLYNSKFPKARKPWGIFVLYPSYGLFVGRSTLVACYHQDARKADPVIEVLE